MVGVDAGAVVLVGDIRASVGVLVAPGADIGVTVLVGTMNASVSAGARVLIALGISVGIAGECPMHATSRIGAQNKSEHITFTEILDIGYMVVSPERFTISGLQRNLFGSI
jgi:hypothetical protein